MVGSGLVLTVRADCRVSTTDSAAQFIDALCEAAPYMARVIGAVWRGHSDERNALRLMSRPPNAPFSITCNS